MDGSLASLHILSQKAILKTDLGIQLFSFISWNFVLQEGKLYCVRADGSTHTECVLCAEPTAAPLNYLEPLLTANTFTEFSLNWDSKSS